MHLNDFVDPEHMKSAGNILGLVFTFLVGGGAAKGYQMIKTLLDQRKSKILPKTINTMMKINNILRELVQNGCADRAVLVRFSNGGKVPKTNSTMYSEVIAEYSSENVEPVAIKWGKRQADEQYIELMDDLITNKYKFIEVSKLRRSQVKTVYMSGGIEFSKLYLLNQSKKGIMFLSINLTGEPSDANYEKEGLIDQSLHYLKEYCDIID